jgi:hypothetical protein
MKAAVIDLYIEQGTDWMQTFAFYSDAGQTRPVDFTGCTGRCKIRDLDGNVVAQPEVSFPVPASGILVLSLPNALTSAIPVDGITYSDTVDCTYDVEVVAPGGAVARWLNGPVAVSPEVTK